MKLKWCGYDEAYFWLAVSNFRGSATGIFIEVFRYRVDIVLWVKR